MERVLVFLERNFTYAMLSGIVLGVLFRHALFPYRFLLPFCIGFSLFAAGVKIDFADVVLHLRRVKRTVAVLALLLVGLPLLISALASPLGKPYEAAALVLFALPAGLTFGTCTAFVGSCSASGQTVTALLGTMAPTAGAIVTITATAPTVTSPTFLTNTEGFLSFSLQGGKYYDIAFNAGGSFYTVSTTNGTLNPTFYFTARASG